MYQNNNHYMNAFQELADVLAENGKTIIQIERVATKEGGIDVNFFLMICEGTFYTNPSPYGSLDPHLIVAGRDFWLTRESEGRIKDVDYWSFHHMPKEPEERAKSLTLFKMYPTQGKIPLIRKEEP